MTLRHRLTQPLAAAVLAASAWIGAGPLAAQPAPRLPVEQLFAEPTVAEVEISPDGRYLAIVMPRNNVRNIVVLDRQTNQRRWVTTMEREHVYGISWVKPDRIMFGQQVDGQESFGLYVVKADGSDSQVILQTGDGDADIRGGRLLDTLENDPENVLVELYRGASGLVDRVVQYNLRTGRSRQVEGNVINANRYFTDNAGVIRLAFVGNLEARGTAMMYRDTPESPWRQLASREHMADGWWPMRFDGDNRLLYIRDETTNPSSIHRFDPAANKRLDVVFQHERYDPESLLWSERLDRVIGVSYMGEKPERDVFDAEYQALFATINRALPGTHNAIVSATDDEQLIVIHAWSDRDPGVFYLFDRANRKIEEIGVMHPQLRPEQMAEMKPIRFQARDGLWLEGYITLPVGVPPRGLPMIVHPHGGPFGPRDEWGFNPEVQFYANRGFAVLQVNFRGSGGYGMPFQRAGYREWGGKMQDDLTDGVRWAIEQGYADPRRVGISGASYGGFATIAGLAFTPELYRFGINYVGATDLDILMRDWARSRSEGRSQFAIQGIGDPMRDAERLARQNPIRHIANIRVPVLNGYGKNDPRVTIDHWERLEREFRQHNVPYVGIVEDDEGHGFARVEARVKWFSEVDRFLAARLAEMGGSSAASVPTPTATPTSR
jgi:dipeptidyl aminopeptidase/acylaminoacyl peptidase